MGKEDVVVRRKESRAGREDDGCRWQVATTVDVVCVRRQDWDKTLRGHGGCRGLLPGLHWPSLLSLLLSYSHSLIALFGQSLIYVCK